jgi:uncharacterized protein (TIGR00369 family)
MTDLLELVRAARASGDPRALVAAIPYSRFVGFTMEAQGGELLGRLTYSESQIGNSLVPALHGGVVGALLESTAVLTVLLKTETLQIPKTISITFDYLRTSRTVDTFAVADLTRLGRRVASVRVIAWQDNRAEPVAAANAHLLLLPPDEPTVGA